MGTLCSNHKSIQCGLHPVGGYNALLKIWPTYSMVTSLADSVSRPQGNVEPVLKRWGGGGAECKHVSISKVVAPWACSPGKFVKQMSGNALEIL